LGIAALAEIGFGFGFGFGIRGYSSCLGFAAVEVLSQIAVAVVAAAAAEFTDVAVGSA
jgi:hypothetical protein